MQSDQNEPTPRHEYRIVPALAVITVGVIFLIRNLGIDIPFLENSNWWAWLILIAALVPLTRAYEAYRASGRVDAEVIYSLLNGAAVVLVAVMFLRGLEWRVWWPLFVILGGLFVLVRGPHRKRERYRRRHETDDAD